MPNQIVLYRSRIVLLIRTNKHKKTTKGLVFHYVVKFYRIFQEAENIYGYLFFHIGIKIKNLTFNPLYFWSRFASLFGNRFDPKEPNPLKKEIAHSL
jgi:hypothetical protein